MLCITASLVATGIGNESYTSRKSRLLNLEYKMEILIKKYVNFRSEIRRNMGITELVQIKCSLIIILQT